MKIGDFGISKRAQEGTTACRTLIGTEGYCAPEVIGFVPVQSGASGTKDATYTSAVDMWALGEIVFRMLTRTPAFPSPHDMYLFAIGQQPLIRGSHQALGLDENCQEFLGQLLVADPAERASAQQIAGHRWLRSSVPNAPAVSENRPRYIPNNQKFCMNSNKN